MSSLPSESSVIALRYSLISFFSIIIIINEFENRYVRSSFTHSHSFSEEGLALANASKILS